MDNNNIIVTDFDDDGVSGWEAGLPNAEDLTPLSQPLIPRELASAFSITPEPHRTNVDVNRASQSTLSSIMGGDITSAHFKSFIGDQPEPDDEDSARKIRRVEAAAEEKSNSNGKSNSKRARLVWTPQLHKRFVEVVAHLGIKSAVPKTIMQMMNVEGLTRENVASHLQKYRLYLKRMQGLSNDGPTSSDPLFASTPVPNSLRESSSSAAAAGVSRSTNVSDVMVSMPAVYGMMGQTYSAGFDYNLMMGHQHHHPLQQTDWGNANKFGPLHSYHHHRISPGGDN